MLLQPHHRSHNSTQLYTLFVELTLVPASLIVVLILRTSADIWTALSWLLFAFLVLVGALVLVLRYVIKSRSQITRENSPLRAGLLAIVLSITTAVLAHILELPVVHSDSAVVGLVFFASSIITRFVINEVSSHTRFYIDGREPVLIYGAGAAGIQLASALNQSREVRPIAFIDDNPNLHGLSVAGLTIHCATEIDAQVRKFGIGRVLIAMPSIAKYRQNEITEFLSQQGLKVLVLPSYIEMMAAKDANMTLRPIAPDELLSRDSVDLSDDHVANTYAGRVVLVTGAGGSIGSELCRQLLDCQPARIVLFEQSEFALYSIDRELRAQSESAGISVTGRLGSVTNSARISKVLKDEGVEIILHAAAYKHVPLVEMNPTEGARVNVLGTQIVAEAAADAGIERFILVSTDKAVRPTNIMGATKRMAELVIQDLQTRSEGTKFSMVRFGNVLGSSGSVLPLFQQQIEAGGPVTVTHEKVTRFFMTIPEASRLVLLAGAYAQGGDVFVLDMGKPQKIVDIARKMITLSGRTIRDPETGVGDIEIKFTGLRPGEKLYEELLIDNNSLVSTPHSKILRASENMLSQIEVARMIREVQASIATDNTERLHQLIETSVEGFQWRDINVESSERVAHSLQLP